MRFLKWISMLAILAMLFAMLPATVAEDEIAIETEEAADEALEIEVEGELEGETLEGLAAIDDPSLSLEDTDLALDGLADADLALDEPEESLLIPETEEQTKTPVAANASGEFDIDENGTLVRYGGFDKNVTIPDGVNKIGNEAFLNYTNLESVNIPDSVTNIEGFIYGAFQGCTGLKSIKLPNSITGLGSWVFEGCTSLTDVTLPNNLEGCGINVFANCTSLKSIVVPKSLKDIGHGMFSGCSSLVSIQLPDSMEELPEGMFNNCDGIKDLVFLTGIKTIGGSAFSDCDGLKSISIPSSVTSISKNAFGNCNNLESVTIHDNVSFIDREAFNNSDNVIIRGSAGSYAERYANGVGIPFNAPVVSFNDSCYDYRDYWDDSNKYAVVYINQYHTMETTQKPFDLARDLTWSSSNPEVAAVDQNGKVKGVSQGSTIITVNTADGKGKAAQIKVVVPEPTSLLFKDGAYWWNDELKNLEIKLRDTRDIYINSEIPYRDETQMDMPVALTSSDRSIVTAQLTDENKVTVKAINLGKATITATTPDGGKASLEVEIIRPNAESIKIDQSEQIKIYPGQKIPLTTTLTPADAEANLTWHTWNADMVTVSQSGVISAVKPGLTTIFVKTDNGCEDEIEVYVLTPPKKVTLSKTSATLAVGGTLTLRATVSPDDAETGFTWTSSNTAVATVSRAGRVTALKVGTAKITVKTDNGKTATATVTVKPVPRSVKLNQTKVTLVEKESLTLEAALSPSDACTTLTWTSSKPACATVSSKGVVTAKQTGATVITVKTDNGKVARATVIVKPLPRSVKLSETRVILGVKEPLTLKATLTPTNAVTALTWTSSKPACATVSGNGVITAKQAGFTVITVKTDNGKVATASIIVRAAPEKVTLNKSGLVTLEKGRTLSLKATLPTNTASGLTWTSSKPGVASVDRNGKVTAKAKGITLITVRTFNGKTAKVTVKVQ